VGRARSSRTEARILSAALRVFAEKGPDAPVVDDFLATTGISRGTFYNHFASVPELLEATSVWTTDTTVASIDAALGGIEDPAVRFGTGLRLFLAKAQSDPVWSLFIARVWKLGPLRPARRDLRAGVRTGAFRVRDVEVALGIVLGGMRAALLEIGARRRSMAYADQVVELCLKALGVEAGRIAEVLGRELPMPRPHTATNAAPHGRKP
jgi:AcrR family transcriptional regulator